MKHSLDERLLGARQEGLREIQNNGSVKAHGKVLGMDTFSWVNPDMDGLSRMIGSMPNASVWVTEFKQVEWLVRNYPELVKGIHAVVIFDSIEDGAADWLDDLRSVAFTQGVSDSLMFLNALESEGMSFFFTISGEKWRGRKEEFESYLYGLY
ncbi:MAG: hypothetical protein MK066_04210 [Crocinitomicaceae bacterium]|nr:hypothetical protein [Crocinitomicaceae bacterium]